MEGKENVSLDMAVIQHTTKENWGEDPVYKVKLSSADKKTVLNLELPDMGRAIFNAFPKGDLFEIV